MKLEEIEKLCAELETDFWEVTQENNRPGVKIDNYFWHPDVNPATYTCDDDMDGCIDIARELDKTAEFIAASRELIPKLLAVAKAAFDFGQDIESIRKALEELGAINEIH